ncbi:MAG: VWA domain-containing protein [Planctomycetota bacterium]
MGSADPWSGRVVRWLSVGACCLLVLGAPVVGGEIPADLRKRLQVAVRAGDESGIRGALDDVARIPGAEAVGLLLDAVPRVPSARVHLQIHESLVGFGAEILGAPFLERLANKKTNPLILAAMLAVGADVEGDAAEQWLLLGLAHPDEMAQRNAIDYLLQRRSKRAIPGLIAILARDGIDQGTTSYGAHQALISLTRRDFDSVEDWQNFWETHGAGLDPTAEPSEGDAGTGVRDVAPDAPTFFGVEIVTRRVVFVVDISGSMTKWDPGGEEGGTGSNWEVRQRIRRLRTELFRAIDKLAKGAKFNVIAYNNEVRSMSGTLVLATPSTKSRAAQWVQKLEADNATHTDEALRKAFQDPEVDTMILLSDGAPMKSREETATVLVPRILEEAKELNRLRKVRIFTFGFEGQGKWPAGSKYARGNAPETDPAEMVRFLKQLAEDHGGKYTAID